MKLLLCHNLTDPRFAFFAAIQEYFKSRGIDYVVETACSPPCQVDSEDVEFSACCLNNLGGNFPSAPWGRSSL